MKIKRRNWFLEKIPLFQGDNSISLAFSILPDQDRRRLYLVVFVQFLLAGLDLLGVLLIGLVGSLAVTGLSARTTGNRVDFILSLFRLSGETLQIQVAVLGLLACTVLVAKSCLAMFFSRKITFFLSRRGAAISADLIRRYFSRPITTLQVRSTQESIYALTSGVNSLMVGLVAAWILLITDLTLLIVLSIGLFIVDTATSLFTLLIFASVAYLMHYLMHKKIKRLGELQARLTIDSGELISQTIHSYRELLVRDRRGYYADQMANTRYALADSNAEMNFMQSINKYILEIAMVVTALVLAGYLFASNTAPRALAVFGIFLAACARIMPAVLRVQQGLLSIRANVGIARPTINLIEELRESKPIFDSSKEFSTSHLGFFGSVQVKGVSFSFNRDRYVLEDVNLSVSEGEFIGIAGESGAGKTTLVDVILGAIEPRIGIVTISGKKPLDAFTLWPGAVSYIPQDTPIINGTVRENICLGYPNQWVSDELCWRSLNMAQLDDVVLSLPKGLDSAVGDRGVKLSGGQRQRLGIARALISQPKLLVLDEATSSLDGVTEAEISESFRKLRGNVTLIVIAHRLSTILDADRIYLLDKGRIKAEGTFEELKKSVPMFQNQASAMRL